MSFASSSERSFFSSSSFSLSLFTRSSRVLWSWSPLTLDSRICWRSFSIRARFCFMVLAMNWMFSMIWRRLLLPSPSLTRLTRFSASLISWRPCWIWLKVSIMSLISLSFWLMILCRESFCSTFSTGAFFSLLPHDANMKSASPNSKNERCFILVVFWLLFFLISEFLFLEFFGSGFAQGVALLVAEFGFAFLCLRLESL